MSTTGSGSRSPLDRVEVSRRQLLGVGGGAMVGAMLAGREVSGALAGSSLQDGGTEFHGAWPYLVPPTGHFHLLEGITNAVLGSTSGAQFSPYADLVLSPMAMYYWKNAEWLPLLAEEWSFSPETDEFTVTLRNGLTWSDGSSLTSQDIVSTFWAVRALRNVVWNYIDGVEALDERAVKFHMSKPSTVVERYVLKVHTVSHAVYGEFADKVRALFEGGQDMDSTEGQALLAEIQNFRPEEVTASGPFTFDYDSITNAQLTLVKNPAGLNADQILFDRVVLYNGETPDVTPVVLAGDVDYATHGFPPATEQAFIEQGLRIVRPPTFGGPALLFNLEKLPEFQDKRVRQAVAHLIDRAQNGTVALMESGVAVQYMAGFSDISVPNWLSEEDMAKLNTYGLDLQRAEELLTEAGWTKDGDTWQTADGNAAEYELLFPAEYADWSASATNLAEQLTAFGIQVTPRSVTFTQEPIDIDKGNFELGYSNWGVGSNPHPHFSFVQDLFTHNIPIAVNQGGQGMAFELVQETEAFGQLDLEQLVVDSAVGLDEEAQKQQVTQLAIAFNELLPMIPLFERYGNNPVLEGVRVQPWPPDDDPIYSNALYGDNPAIMLLLTGTLKPVE